MTDPHAPKPEMALGRQTRAINDLTIALKFIAALFCFGLFIIMAVEGILNPVSFIIALAGCWSLVLGIKDIHKRKHGISSSVTSDTTPKFQNALSYTYNYSSQFVQMFKHLFGTLFMGGWALVFHHTSDSPIEYFGAVFFVFAACGSVLMGFSQLQYIFQTDFISIERDGIVLRNSGFVPWEKFQKITPIMDRIAFQFILQNTDLHKKPLFYTFPIGSYQRKGDVVLMLLPLTGLEPKTTPLELWFLIQHRFASYLDPKREYNERTPCGITEETIKNAKIKIEFYDDKIVKNFKNLPDAL